VVAERDLRDACTPGLSADARLTIAYNAALQCATAALAASGYRPVREAHHVRVIESLEFTIGWEAEDIRTLERFRRQRHRAWYERAYTTSEAEANEMLALAEKLRDDVLAWLRAHHPSFVPEERR